MNAKTISVSSIDTELNILSILLEVDANNTKLLNSTPKEKTETEIKYRINCGLKPYEKELLKLVLPELYKEIYQYFLNHNEPRCPQEVYVNTLRMAGILPSKFMEIVVKNDGALKRWEQRSGEWHEFSKDRAVKRYQYLENLKSEKLKEKSQEKKQISINEIFDGGLL